MANFGLFSKTPIFRVFSGFLGFFGFFGTFRTRERSPHSTGKTGIQTKPGNPGIPDRTTRNPDPKSESKTKGLPRFLGVFLDGRLYMSPIVDPKPENPKTIFEKGEFQKTQKWPKNPKKTRKIGIKVYIYAFLMVFRGFPVEKAFFRLLFLARGFRLRSVLGQEFGRFWDEHKRPWVHRTDKEQKNISRMGRST